MGDLQHQVLYSEDNFPSNYNLGKGSLIKNIGILTVVGYAW